MKKFLSLIICAIFVLSLTACSENGTKTNGGGEIERYAKAGQIKEVEYKLGDDVSTTKEALSAAYNAVEDSGEEHDHDHEHEAFYMDFETGDYTVMSDGNVLCCYVTDKKSDGITHIINNGTSYGFEQGTISTQVRDAMSKLGYDTTERDADKSELFFLPGSANMNMTVLEYKFDENTVLFVFEDSALSATVIFK